MAKKEMIIGLDELEATNNDLFIRKSCTDLDKNAQVIVEETHCAIMIKDGEMTDTVSSYFGLRTVDLREKAFCINGYTENVKIFVCVVNINERACVIFGTEYAVRNLIMVCYSCIAQIVECVINFFIIFCCNVDSIVIIIDILLCIISHRFITPFKMRASAVFNIFEKCFFKIDLCVDGVTCVIYYSVKNKRNKRNRNICTAGNGSCFKRKINY